MGTVKMITKNEVIMYCYNCMADNDSANKLCENCKVILNNFYQLPHKISEQCLVKQKEFYKSKNYAMFICIRIKFIWFQALAFALSGSMPTDSFFKLTSILEYNRAINAFKYLKKENQIDTIVSVVVNYFENYRKDFLTIYSISDFYQNPFRWNENREYRQDPNVFFDGEDDRDRMIRLLGNDIEFMTSFNRLMKAEIQEFLEVNIHTALV